MPEGIIVKGIGGFYYVVSNNAVYECKARGIFRKDGLTPLPGDRVFFSVDHGFKQTGSIDEVLPRTNYLVRPAVANVDQMVIVIALKSPQPDFILVDKLLITAESKGLKAVLCVNKSDLDMGNECAKIHKAYSTTGYPIITASTIKEEGMECLNTVLKGHISVLAGQSGVGKSSILNRLFKDNIMETGEISSRNERGRHTTRHAELIQLECGGYLADTPGFSSFEIAGIGQEDLKLYYPEFAEFNQACRFHGCSHISEPGCRVKEALREGAVDQGRYERYCQLYSLLGQEKTYKRGFIQNKKIKRK